ncbi:cystathionine beta-lyase [Pseudomonas matsuisoli]|uniref:Cystathionine beta-lyase n=1 Tax=Pseudomonas matsuisoli TaxID=1515666 RepID=A0A917Q1R7_9PSED|nr:cystathionine beta-lyase [Pseudomonas matsuisoli]GGK04872.1 cystathionine beta-lyase [Pseudomonas matsuisoli]
MPNDRKLHTDTRIVHAGRDFDSGIGRPFNPPVVRWSSVLFDNLKRMRETESRGQLSYGANGNPTAQALEAFVTELEGGHGTRLYATGLAAIAQMFQSYLRPGDHVLITDAVYGPVRRLANNFLAPFGIEFEYFAADGCDIESLIRPNTAMVYAEVPGSLAFEMCDLPALSTLCKRHDILLAVDNTWGSGVLYRPLQLGADISVMALTKYIAGHSDVMMGSVTTTEACWETLTRMNTAVGNTVSPDDAYLVLRGARTVRARLAMHQQHALQVAEWLQARPEVARVLHPALPDDPSHALWQRDFSGANGLLSFEFKQRDPEVIDRFVAALKLFGIGYSWGGFESLVSVVTTRGTRSVADWSTHGPMLRLHVGLENPDDLIRDLEAGFAAIG